MDRSQVDKPIDVLFARRLRRFTGGHLKVFHYMAHIASSTWARAQLYLTSDSDETLLTELLPSGCERLPKLATPDCAFVAGQDWDLFDAAKIDLDGITVVNLIQHVRHAVPSDVRYRFLNRKALRICVSDEVADAVKATGLVRGPVRVVPNATDLTDAQKLGARQPNCVFIGGLKNPSMANDCADRLRDAGYAVDVCTELLPRHLYLQRMGACAVALLLPDLSEGFYLPALEAMAMGVAVIVPDCVGNRSFSRNGDTCLVPPYDVESICDAADVLLNQPGARASLVDNGLAEAARHSLTREREMFLGLFHSYLNGTLSD